MRQLIALLLVMLVTVLLPAYAQEPAPPPIPLPTRAPHALTELSVDRSPAQAPTPAAAPIHAQAPQQPQQPDKPPLDAPQAPVAAPQAPAVAQAPRAQTDLPLDRGLPLAVRAGLAFIDVEGIDENKESFTATVDLRLSWLDPRLRYPAEEAPIGYREWRGEAATAQLATIWSPEIGLANLRGEPTRESRGLRLYPDGRVELLRRVAGSFGSSFDVQRFPFDRQQLQVELVSQDETADKVTLDYRQDDLLFSRADPGIEIGGWTVGAVNLTRDPLSGWYGESYARLRVTLEVNRQASVTVPSLFVPLLASLLIPLLATWLNRSHNGEFETESVALANVIIGGLFAVIALNFTVNSERSILASSTNTVSLLFGLNYLALAAALVINVCLFRFNVVRALAGRHVQHETFRYITWAMPIAIAATAVALILIAAA
jgi:hypothetical protein